MFIAVYINSFAGKFEPYGVFDTMEEAKNWIDEHGIKKPASRSDRSLWSTFEVTNVEPS
jgi:hypothetical protein